MKLHKMVIEVWDFEGLSLQDTINCVEDCKYLTIYVHDVKTIEIKDWSDDHPLNKTTTHEQTFFDLFKDI